METKQKREVVELGRRIKAIIVDKNLKIMDVAHDANLDSTNFRKYVRGSQEMKITTLLRIATALGVTASDLIAGLEIKKEG